MKGRASFVLSRDIVLALGAPAVYLKSLYPPMGQANPATHLRPQGFGEKPKMGLELGLGYR